MDSKISAPTQLQPRNKTKSFRSCYVFSFLIFPVFLAFILYRLDPTDPIAVPDHRHHPVSQPKVVDGRILGSLERVGSGHITGPEDLVYDPISRVMYTGCGDGWIKRVVPGDGLGFEDETVAVAVAVEEVVNTGGRPLGLALSSSADGYDLIIADAFKGLLKLTRDKELVLLTKEAEGEEFKLTDGVDVAKDGTIYFTDASSKHTLAQFAVAHMEGRPNGRLLSFDPTTRETRVLLRDLYFPNGVALSPDQRSLIFCETMLRMCKRYHITGTLAGSVEPFVDDTLGSPDNIHYDGEGHYWIGLPTFLPAFLNKVANHPLVRKGLIIVDKYIGLQSIMKSGGVLAVDLEGNLVAHFYDGRLSAITVGTKIGQQLYMGSLYYEHIFRLNLTQHAF